MTVPRLSIAFSVAETCLAIVAASPSISLPTATKAAIACAESQRRLANFVGYQAGQFPAGEAATPLVGSFRFDVLGIGAGIKQAKRGIEARYSFAKRREPAFGFRDQSRQLGSLDGVGGNDVRFPSPIA